jgi:hypothetical protein
LRNKIIGALEESPGQNNGPFTPEGVLDRNFGKKE